MRPIAAEQNPLRYPLNEILGTRAQVRMLRVMANEVEGPLSASDVAKRAGLTVPGTHKALGRLLESGFISQVGGGRQHQYEIRRSDRLMQIIIELFQAEKDRYESLLAAIKRGINSLTPPPQAVWILSGPPEMNEPLLLGVLHDSFHLAECVRQFRAALNQIENDFDLTIELNGYTKADIPDFEPDELTPLYGVLPASSNGAAQRQAKKTYTHTEKDHHLRMLSLRLADLLHQDASLLRRAKNHINRLLQEDQGPATGDLREWQNILNSYPIQRLARFFTSSSERANRLRQSNPFFAVLNADERARMFDEFGEKV